MTTQTKDINMISGGVRSYVNVSQYDVGSEIKFALYNNSSAFTPPAGTTVRVEGRKPDGNGFSYLASLSDNVVTVTVKDQMTVLSGEVLCELRLTKDSVDIGTANFILAVEEAPINSDIPISDTEIPAIIELARQEQYTAEAWAKGTRNGVPVSSGDETYHNNAKYWAEESSEHIVVEDDDEVYVSRQGKGNLVNFNELVGGSFAWNQLVQNGNFANGNTSWNAHTGTTRTTSDGVCTFDATASHGIYQTGRPIIKGHKYMQLVMIKASVANVNAVLVVNNPSAESTKQILNVPTTFTLYANFVTGADTGNGTIQIRGLNTVSGAEISVKNIMFIDLSYNTSIVDAIYAMEQATAGSGVAWFKHYFPNDYYAYDAGSIQSVNVSARKVYDSDNNLIVEYPLPTTQLRGIPSVVNNKLVYDGDVLKSDGSVTRKYGIVDLGTLTGWTTSTAGGQPAFRTAISNMKNVGAVRAIIGVCQKYPCSLEYADKACFFYEQQFYVWDSDYSSSTAEQFKTAMSGVYLVYELATPTTELAEPYQNPQRSDASGTEEFVDYGVESSTRDVSIPVGTNSTYTTSAIIPPLEDYTDGATMSKVPISAIGTDESNNDKASQAYSQGDYFYKKGIAKAKTSIASGATFTLGTNYEIKTLAEILKALES